MTSIFYDTLHDIPGYRMEAGGYSAFICAELGANCIQLQTERASYLRTPENFQQIKDSPYLYGMPILFPPNRIEGGTYKYNGITYTFPINEPQRGHHIHGTLSSTPFAPRERWHTSRQASITLSYEATEKNPYLAFPHTFRVLFTYLLDQEGLHQTVQVENTSTSPMPIGLGFHTTLRETFLQDTNAKEYTLQLEAEKEIMFDKQTIIPTGEFMEDNQLLKELRNGVLSPGGRALSNHLVAQPGILKQATYIHLDTHIALRYSTTYPYAFWMLFNGGGDKGFLCIEPQTWIIDAPNSPLPAHDTGFQSLACGESLTLHATLQEVQQW